MLWYLLIIYLMYYCDQVADGIVPNLLSLPKTILREPLESPVTDRMSFMSVAISTLPVEGVDHINLNEVNLPDGMVYDWL